MTDRWLLYGCRTSYAADVAEILWRLGLEVVLVDNLGGSALISDLGRVIVPADLESDLLRLPAVVPLTTPGHRFTAVDDARQHGLTHFPALLDPTSVLARTSSVGEGSIVNAGVVVAARTVIDRFVNVNRSVSLGHDGLVEDFVTLGPGCVLAGHVTVHTGAFIGAGATIAPETTIGENATVGAGAVVVRDVPDGAVVVGNPAKVIRSGTQGYGGVAVPVPRPDGEPTS